MKKILLFSFLTLALLSCSTQSAVTSENTTQQRNAKGAKMSKAGLKQQNKRALERVSRDDEM